MLVTLFLEKEKEKDLRRNINVALSTLFHMACMKRAYREHQQSHRLPKRTLISQWTPNQLGHVERFITDIAQTIHTRTRARFLSTQMIKNEYGMFVGW
jgi:hypothetical protein